MSSIKNLPLQGKTVLLLCQKFYDYDNMIANQIIALGGQVLIYENIFFREDPVLYKDLFCKLKRWFNPGYKEQYVSRILKEIEGVKIDYFLAIGGFSVTEFLLSSLRDSNPEIMTTLYLWDSVSVWNYTHLFSFFDQVYSFDRQDCNQYALQYYPLFYPIFSEEKRMFNEKKVDVMYVASIGTRTTDRVKFSRTIDMICRQKGLNTSFYLFHNPINRNYFIQLIKKILSKEYRIYLRILANSGVNFLHEKPLPSTLYHANLKRSKCVIDIPLAGQVGLTMRTIESLAFGCKLITTNARIKEESFFDERWIMIINKDFDQNDLLNFIITEPSENLQIERYRLDNWLMTILLDERA